MNQGDDENIRRKAYEIWEQEGRPEGRHEDHWRRARETFRQDKSTAEISGDTTPSDVPTMGEAARDATPNVAANDVPSDLPASDMDTQDKAMIPENGAENVSRTTEPDPGSAPAPAKRPRTQRKKTPAT
jgi:hypothetical protein